MCNIVLGVCECNATGCGATTDRKMLFDVTFTADHAYGSGDLYRLQLLPVTP
jgi:hypothetical protein